MTDIPEEYLAKARDALRCIDGEFLPMTSMAAEKQVAHALMEAEARGMEKAARWHDDNAASLFQNMTADTSYGRGELMMQEAEFHSASATAIRTGACNV